MSFMNQADIENMANRKHACPNVRKGVNLMLELMRAVNAQSDGWHSWPVPSNSCEKLVALLKTAGNLWYDTDGTITAAQLKAAVAPIRRMVTTQKVKQAKFGNTFEFDVDMALGIKPKPPEPPTLLDYLEELLSITEKYKHNMSAEDVRRWSTISAIVADERGGSKV